MTRILSLILLFFSTNTFGQTIPSKKMMDYIKSLNLLPLNKVDTLSKNIPKDIVTKSNWHLDYYASITQNDGPAQLNVYELVYNDSIFCSTWRPYNTLKKIEYNFLEFKDESDKFIYFGIKGTSIDEYLFIISKTKNDIWFQFSDLLYKDMINGIFIEYSSENCAESEMPTVLDVVNINTDKFDRIKLNGFCKDIKTCLVKVSYSNGQLTVTANLTKKRTKKLVTATKSIKI